MDPWWGHFDWHQLVSDARAADSGRRRLQDTCPTRRSVTLNANDKSVTEHLCDCDCRLRHDTTITPRCRGPSTDRTTPTLYIHRCQTHATYRRQLWTGNYAVDDTRPHSSEADSTCQVAEVTSWRCPAGCHVNSCTLNSNMAGQRDTSDIRYPSLSFSIRWLSQYFHSHRLTQSLVVLSCQTLPLCTRRL